MTIKTLKLTDVRIRSIDDRPIRFLFLLEAFSNVIFLLGIFIFPSEFIEFLFGPVQHEIHSLTIDFLFWWSSWLILLTIFMFIAVIRTDFGTKRRFIYWILLLSEVFLAFLLVQRENRTKTSIIVAIGLLFIVFARLFVLFVKHSWFGIFLLEVDRIKIE